MEFLKPEHEKVFGFIVINKKHLYSPYKQLRLP